MSKLYLEHPSGEPMGTIYMFEVFVIHTKQSKRSILYIMSCVSVETFAFCNYPRNPQITRDLPIAAKTAWDIVPEEKVYNAFLQQ